MIILNSMQDKGAGFGYDTNRITIIDRNNIIDKFELKSKEEAARDILDKIVSMLKKINTNGFIQIIKIFFSDYSVILAVKLIYSQELNCNVQVSAQKIQGSNRQVFESMQRDIYEFMNNTVWTNHVFSYAERIDCNILIQPYRTVFS